jgi:probable F420-dependent oxidoreductase
MELDCYFPDGVRLSEAAAAAAGVQDAGFAAMWVTETKHNPFLACGAGLAAADRIQAGSGIAVAFPRSPMVTAQLAWDLAEASDGRFVLGLGSQVKAHIQRRFAAPFDRPVPRLREYVHAVRAIFAAFRGDGKLRFAGDFYDFSLLTDFFNPGPISHPDIPVWVAAVGPAMLRMAGECCDGVFLHPLHSVDFLRATVLPAVTAGASATGRNRADVTLCCPVFVAVGDSAEDIERQRTAIARQIAFFINMFGQTEGSPIACLAQEDHERALADQPDLLASVGRPAPGIELRLAGTDSGEVGEILARGAHLFKTAEDGWLHTGDLARMDEDGYVYLIGRLGDRIKRGGENVHPVEVEDVLREHPAVLEVAVVGVPDEEFGQLVRAFIVLHPSGAAPSREELRAFAREELAGFKVPTSWVFVPDLPRNASGKILRRALAEST